MSWTDYSSTPADGYDPNFKGDATDVSGLPVDTVSIFHIMGYGAADVTKNESINSLEESFNIPGFEDGYQPSGTPDPIRGNIDEGGGGPAPGPTRPTAGMLYPRGQG